MEQMPPLFDENQQLDKFELLDSLPNKVPRSHRTILTSQGFNPETGDMETFMEHFKRSETTYNISGVKFDASDKDRNTNRKKKRSYFKEQDENGKNCHKKRYLLYCSLHEKNQIHTSR